MFPFSHELHPVCKLIWILDIHPSHNTNDDNTSLVFTILLHVPLQQTIIRSCTNCNRIILVLPSVGPITKFIIYQKLLCNQWS